MRIKSFIYALLGFGADVITVSSGTAGNAGSTAAELITYMRASMLEVAELNMVLKQFGEAVALPSKSSKTVRMTRMEKFSVSSSPTQLVEGISPDADPLTIAQVEASIEQYGKVIRISELAELTASHPLIEKAIYTLGLHASEIYDQLVFNVIDAASNVYRPNSRAADTDLVHTDRIAYADFASLLALHQDNGARPFDGGDYVFVCPPQVNSALLLDPDFKAANQFADAGKLFRGEVGRLAGLRVVTSNAPAFAATAQAGSGDASKVYSSFMLGRFAYQVVDLQSLETNVVPPGGHTDVLKQSYKIGYKFSAKTVISNQSWIRRIRSAGLNSVTNP